MPPTSFWRHSSCSRLGLVCPRKEPLTPRRRGFPRRWMEAFSSSGQKAIHRDQLSLFKLCFRNSWMLSHKLEFLHAREFMPVFLGKAFLRGRGGMSEWWGKEGEERGKVPSLSLQICFLSCHKLHPPLHFLSIIIPFPWGSSYTRSFRVLTSRAGLLPDFD